MAEQKDQNSTPNLWTSNDWARLKSYLPKIEKDGIFFCERERKDEHSLIILKKGRKITSFILVKREEGGVIYESIRSIVKKIQDTEGRFYLVKIIGSNTENDSFVRRESEAWKLIYPKLLVENFRTKTKRRVDLYKHYILMPKFGSKNLAEARGVYQDNTGKLENFAADEISCIIVSLAEKLELLHKAGFVHRDIKLENAIFNPVLKEAYLLDFDSVVSSGTKTWGGGGTPCFAAPEVYFSAEDREKNVTKIFYQSADIFSFGILILELLTGIRRDPVRENFDNYISRCLASEVLKELFAKEQPQIFTQFLLRSLAKFLRRMTHQDPNMRPNIHEVLQFFKKMEPKNHLKSIVDELEEKIKPTIEDCICVLKNKHVDPRAGSEFSILYERLNQKLDTNAAMGSEEFVIIAEAVAALPELCASLLSKMRTVAEAKTSSAPAFFKSDLIEIKRIEKVITEIRDDWSLEPLGLERLAEMMFLIGKDSSR